MCSEKDMGYLGEDWDCVIFRLNKAFLTDVPQLLGTQQHSKHLMSSSHPLLPQGSNHHKTTICHLQLVIPGSLGQGGVQNVQTHRLVHVLGSSQSKTWADARKMEGERWQRNNDN